MQAILSNVHHTESILAVNARIVKNNCKKQAVFLQGIMQSVQIPGCKPARAALTPAFISDKILPDNKKEKPLWIKRCLLPPGKRMYKANLHTHTVMSDGKYTPGEMKALYVRQGYQIVAFTDHDICIAHPELCSEDFLPLTGYEMSIHEAIPCYDQHKVCHLCLISKKADMAGMVCFDRRFILRGGNMWKYEDQLQILTTAQREYSQDFIQQAIREGNEAGYLVTLNHPFWSMQTYDEYAHLEGLWGIEVFNAGSHRLGNGDDTDRALEDLLRCGAAPMPVAADDSHDETDVGGGWVMIAAEELSYDAVIRAMEKGDLYASSGPEIRSLYMEDGMLHISTSPCRSIHVLTETRLTAYVKAADAPLTEAVIDLHEWRQKATDRNETNAYIRLRIEDEQSRCAYTRAYPLAEISPAF